MKVIIKDSDETYYSLCGVLNNILNLLVEIRDLLQRLPKGPVRTLKFKLGIPVKK